MSNSTGCKVLATALVVAVLMGGVGFAAGYLSRGLLAGEAASLTPTVVVQVVTATPTSTTAAQAPTDTAVPPPSPTPAEFDTRAYDLFNEAWGLILRDYYGDLPSDEEVIDGAIRGALKTLDDPYTGYIEPDAAAIGRANRSGSFEGIGAFVTMEDDRLSIVEAIEGQPAEAAGLRRGDIILQVDDTPIENMSIYEAISLIRGPAGTTVRLKIAREGEEPFDVEIVRATIEIEVVRSEMRSDGIGYVRLTQFNTDASAKLAEAIRGLLAQDPKGLILDLRGNPGGWLHEAVLVSGLFLPQGQVVLFERTKDGAQEVFTTPDAPVAPDIPLVVLVDGASASASEIVAGALQDHKRAVLVGEKTFGKGSVQWPEELSNGGELRVTRARWFTPLDRAIHGAGLEPDVAVEITLEDMEAGADPQLERAAQYLLTGK